MKPSVAGRRAGRGTRGRRPRGGREGPMRGLRATQAEAYAKAVGKRLPTEAELSHAYLVAAVASWLVKQDRDARSPLVQRLTRREGLEPSGRPAEWVRTTDGRITALPLEPGHRTRAPKGVKWAPEAALRLAQDGQR